jgi:hypothetical protein
VDFPSPSVESVDCDHPEVFKISLVLANESAECHWIRLRHAKRDECARVLVRFARQRAIMRFCDSLTTNLVGCGDV